MARIFNAETFRENEMEILNYDILCKFTAKPKYDVKLKKPNAFDLDWVYSMPCGETDCKSWVFIDTETAPDWGADLKIWIENYISDIGWNVIANRDNRRFQCPACATSFPPLRI